VLAMLGGEEVATLLARQPGTITPQTPIALARVSVSASTREPTTRIVPADPTSRPPERSSPSAPAWSRPRVGFAQRHDARIPRPAARIVMLVRPDVTNDPANGDSTGSAISPVATRQRSCHWNTNSPPGPRSSPRRGGPSTSTRRASRSRGHPPRPAGDRGSVRRWVLRPRPSRRARRRGGRRAPAERPRRSAPR